MNIQIVEGFPVIPESWPTQLETRTFPMPMTVAILEAMHRNKDIFKGIKGSQKVWEASYMMFHGGAPVGKVALACAVMNKAEIAPIIQERYNIVKQFLPE